MPPISRHQDLSFPLQTDMRPDNSGVIVWRQTKKTKHQGGDTAFHTHHEINMSWMRGQHGWWRHRWWNIFILRLFFQFAVIWGWCCINIFITNHSQAGLSFIVKYHLIITCITDTSQFTTVPKVPQISQKPSFQRKRTVKLKSSSTLYETGSAENIYHRSPALGSNSAVHLMFWVMENTKS